ncbi:MAG: ATPase, T2SS/T4P/T4SS family [Bacteriovoracaceae bacterium]|jgi:type IV pilus assembly protein PilB|nr:ATPase, T2SS/T4P/T4SS family [Bacteriovoracaceae bacterium]
MIRKQFVDILSNTGLVTLKEIRRLMMNKDRTEVTELELLDLVHFDQNKLAKILAEKFSMTYVDLEKARVAKSTVKLLPKKNIIKYRAIPIQATGEKVVLATFDPSTKNSIAQLGQDLRKPVDLILTNLSSWKKIFELAEDSVEDLIGTIVEVKAKSDQDEEIKAEDIGNDVVTYVNKILSEAFIKKVSDIHIEPYEKIFRVRFRIDGSLVEVDRPPRSLMLPMISRLKIMAELDISEKRKPQDGRIKLQIGGKPIDYRVSSLPTLFGEKVVLRLLDQSSLELDMTKLGFEKKQLEVFKEGIHQPYGMVLVTGPTGSGKTTTLYSALSELNTIDTNISTAEDPCEFNLEGINQVNVRKEVGLTFASCLKSFLRQDPDIIMVGEIRDLEVGEIAVEASLTGHMVLSTLHTNDAPSAITRLLNMGIEGFLVVASLRVVVAQRLLRRICTNCRVEDQVDKAQLIACGFAPSSADRIKIYRGKGCENCNGTGYKGRVAIYEVLELNSRIRELVLENASVDDIKRRAIKSGMKTLRMCALTKVAQGITTLDEAIANSASDNL